MGQSRDLKLFQPKKKSTPTAHMARSRAKNRLEAKLNGTFTRVLGRKHVKRNPNDSRSLLAGELIQLGRFWLD
jgi:hypothetical protein